MEENLSCITAYNVCEIIFFYIGDNKGNIKSYKIIDGLEVISIKSVNVTRGSVALMSTNGKILCIECMNPNQILIYQIENFTLLKTFDLWSGKVMMKIYNNILYTYDDTDLDSIDLENYISGNIESSYIIEDSWDKTIICCYLSVEYGLLYIGYHNGLFKIYDLKDNRSFVTVKICDANIIRIKRHDGNLIICTEDHKFSIYNALTFEYLTTVTTSSDIISF